MNTIRNIRADLEENWNALQGKDWQCAAQIRFGQSWCTPMLAQIDMLDSAMDELEALCRESLDMANAVREPEENEEWGHETCKRD